MAEQLQPSLLDRLTLTQAPSRRGFSAVNLRDAVKRDLAWLFNTTSLAATEDLGDYPAVEQSVLNFGLPDLSGKTVSGVDAKELERLIRLAIWRFEPRLLRDSVKVRAMPTSKKGEQNVLTFEIEADLWGEPLPLHIVLNTQIDLDLGDVTVADGRVS